MRIGITGHSNLAPDALELVTDALREAVTSVSGGEPVTGVTCLAGGADQLFARAVLDLGGVIEVVLPAADYRQRKVKPEDAAEFAELIREASAVTTLPFATSNRDAYMAASERVLSSVGAIVAVWDGRPSDGKGGTGDVVVAARERGIPVTVVWPEGAHRV